jgi:hypothetical protein
MAKISMIAFVAVFALGLFVAGAYAGEEMAKGINRLYGQGEIIGSEVKNLQGVHLGRITDLVIDPEGRVAFAILAHGGFLRMGETSVAVPFDTLTYDQKGKHFALDISTERLKSAPAFAMNDLASEKWAEEVYRYFGRQPYWTEGGLVMEGMKPIEEEGMGTMEEYPHGVHYP